MPRKLTLKQKRFVEAYLETGNATEAARRAGYGTEQSSDSVMAVVGWHNIRNAKIQKQIEARIADSKVTADEVIGTLANHMRADITDLLEESGAVDINVIRERKLGHLIKKVRVKRYVERKGEDSEAVEVTEFELHSQQAAAVQLCKVLGLEKEPAANPRDLARVMLEKQLTRGISQADAVRSLVALGVDPDDLDLIEPLALPAAPENAVVAE